MLFFVHLSLSRLVTLITLKKKKIEETFHYCCLLSPPNTFVITFFTRLPQIQKNNKQTNKIL